MIGLIAQNVMVAIDTAFLGRVGEVALGAGALGGLFYFAIVVLGIGFGTGTQILIGRRNGEKSFPMIGRIADHAFYLLIVLAVLLFIILFFLAPDILHVFIKSKAVYAGTIQFLKYRSWGIFFALINIVFTSFYVGTVKTRMLTYSTIITAITNIILDYLFIFGNAGFPEMGIAGAGFASAIAEMVTMVFFITRTYFFEDIKKYQLFKFKSFDKTIMSGLLNLSIPVMLQNFLSFFGWFVFFMIIEHLGEQALAVSNICRSIYMLMIIPIWGLSSACNTLVSNAMGEGMKDKVISLIKKISVMSFLLSMIAILVLFIFPRAIVAVYTNDVSLIPDSINVLYVIAITMIFFSVGMVMFQGVSGTGNTKVTFMFEIIAITVYQITAYVLAIVLKTPVYYVWIVECMYFVMIGTMSFIYLRTGKWRHTKI
jgi:putative MATE family efflux protein